VGMRMVTDVLRGSKNQALLNRGYDKLSTYALLRDLSEQEVRYYMESLIHLNFLKLTEGEYPVLKWTEHSLDVVNGQQNVNFNKRKFKASKEEKDRVKKSETTFHYDATLFETLRQLRLKIAREEEVPPYVVFSDRALQEMAVYYPQTQFEFVKINGVGPIKWVKYGEKFLEMIRSHASGKVIPEREQIAATPLQRTHSLEKTVSLYQQGHSVDEIVEIRQLAKSTILTHLVEAIQQGLDLDISPLISIEKQVSIKAIIAEVGAERLTPIKERLSADFSYDDIRLVAAFCRRSRIIHH
jgi:ATP-dependent DNA helicase RecQ